MAFFIYFDSQTKISFEEIKTSSKFAEKNSGFVSTRFTKPSVEQIIGYGYDHPQKNDGCANKYLIKYKKY